ncbi:hypothetical protein MUP01_10635 [Candidatus Bathyarchaeota archaeon]|nr:hypothetical protein [Candidatus Bathyarchaeota archaeon]
MNKTKLVLVGVIVAALCFAGFVYALTTLSWTQNPQVPTGSFVAYRSDGITEITQGSNQTSIWAWNGATFSFNTTIIIKNNGNSSINVAVDYSGLDAFWTPNGFGTQTSIAIGETRQVKLGISNTSAQSEDFVGLFTVSMTIVP